MYFTNEKIKFRLDFNHHSNFKYVYMEYRWIDLQIDWLVFIIDIKLQTFLTNETTMSTVNALTNGWYKAKASATKLLN